MKDIILNCAKNGSYLPYYLSDLITSDIVTEILDGTACKTFLEKYGFTVISHGNCVRYAKAITKCGIILSSNGFVTRRSEK